jgi:hypothetical protein
VCIKPAVRSSGPLEFYTHCTLREDQPLPLLSSFLQWDPLSLKPSDDGNLDKFVILNMLSNSSTVYPLFYPCLDDPMLR